MEVVINCQNDSNAKLTIEDRFESIQRVKILPIKIEDFNDELIIYLRDKDIIDLIDVLQNRLKHM